MLPEGTKLAPLEEDACLTPSLPPVKVGYRYHAGHDHPGPLVLPYWAIEPSTLTLRPNLPHYTAA